MSKSRQLGISYGLRELERERRHWQETKEAIQNFLTRSPEGSNG